MRLLVGTICVGLDELRRQVRTWEADGMPPEGKAASRPTPASRAVLLGLLFEVPDRLAEVLVSLRAQEKRLGAQVTRASAPLLRSRLGAPLVRHVSAVRATLRRLEKVGRAEEERSRALALRAVESLAQKTFERLADATQVREVVVEQGMTLAGEVLEELHTHAEQADRRLERAVRSLLRLRARKRHAASGPAAPSPAHG